MCLCKGKTIIIAITTEMCVPHPGQKFSFILQRLVSEKICLSYVLWNVTIRKE